MYFNLYLNAENTCTIRLSITTFQRRSTDVSTSTVQRRLRDAGLKGIIAAKKPLLRVINRKKRHASVKNTENGHLRSGSQCYGRMSPNSKYLGQTAEYLRDREDERMSSTCVVPTLKHGGR